MADLTDEQKTFIVQCLACFDSPSEVAALVKEEWNVEVTRQQVRHYNPLQVECAPKWAALFHVTREAFLKDQAAIGIAQKSYRLKVLQDVLHRALAKRNYPMVLEALEKAAKDCGGAYTNARQISGSLGLGIDDFLTHLDSLRTGKPEE